MVTAWRLCRLPFLALYDWINPGDFLLNVLARPVVAVLGFGLLSDRVRRDLDTATFVVGAAAMGLTWVTLGGVVQCVFNERQAGTLAIALASPFDRRLLLLTRTAFHIPTGIFGVLLSVLIAAPVFGLGLAGVTWPAFLLATAVTTLSVAAVALSLCTISLAVRDMWSIVALVGGLIAAFSGGFVPATMLPSPVSDLSRAMPMHWGIEAMRLAFRGDAGAAFGTSLLYESLNAALWLVASMILFQAFESSMKKHGSWEAV